ncbi:MAG: tRNA pseudouridine(55) synthase TruB [Cyclobacteriaceae bacterium]|nr:tRNA pseudouridine(55) synthase TruB [Cyclobacteriaceae bacterium]
MNNYLDKVLLLNKPLGWTSFDVVNKLRKKLKIKKIGHAGTLDPLATGLLVICTGKMTKQIDGYQAQEKEYTGKLILGQTTPSHDLETPVTEPVSIEHLSESELITAAKKFQGTIQQVPPLHSAIKIDGKRAYAFARKGKEVELKPREVVVSAFEITEVQKPTITFRIVCSKGTYIRSLARDFGNELGVGAYLSELCRTRIGDFRLEQALSLDDINPELP